MTAATMVHSFNSLVAPVPTKVPAFTPVRDLAPSAPGALMLRLNGAWLLRKDWGRIVAPGDVVEWHEIPAGGNTSRTVLQIVIVIAAAYFGGAVGGALGFSGNTAAAVGSLAISIVGNAVLNALIPLQQANLGLGSAASPGSVYNASTAANQARLSQPIPIIYGRHKVFPDYASQPYVEYRDNDQYFHAFYCVGQGLYTIREGEIYIDDTPLSHFTDIWYRVLQPGDLPTRVHADVVTAPEVAGQAIVYGKYSGSFAACGPRQTAAEIGADVLFDRLGIANNDGSMAEKTVSLRFEARTIDDFGVPTSAWFVLGSPTFTAATTTPQRFSCKYTLPTPGRVEVRVIRLDEKDDSGQVFNDPVWGGLRAYLSTPATLCPSATHFELVMRASEQLSGLSQRKVAMIPRRKLLTWHPDTGFSDPVETRNPAWALMDIWLSTAYGDALPPTRVDLQTLYELSREWDARQDRCDIVFDSRITSWDAAKTVAQTGRATPFRRMGVNTVVRDSKHDLPVTAYTTRNMLPGASISYALPTEQTADGIIVEYFDGRSWDWREILCRAPGVTTPQNPVRLRLAGITGAKQAEREGLYQAAQNLYRRKFPTWLTELEGMLPAYGSLVMCAPPMGTLIQAGDIAGWDDLTRTASLTEPPEFQPGKDHFIVLLRDDGSVTAPIKAVPGPNANEVVLDITPDFDPVFDAADRERTKYFFGSTEGHRVMTRVLGIRKRGRGGDGALTVEMTGVVEDDRVHLADNHLLPGPGEIQDPVDSTATPVGETPIIVSMTDRTIEQDNINGTGPGLFLRNNGQAEEMRSASTPTGGPGSNLTPIASEWLQSVPVETSVAAGYEVRATVTSSRLWAAASPDDFSDGGPPDGSAVGVWLNLGTSRSWFLQAALLMRWELVLRIEIRQIGSAIVQSDHLVTLSLIGAGGASGGGGGEGDDGGGEAGI